MDETGRIRLAGSSNHPVARTGHTKREGAVQMDHAIRFAGLGYASAGTLYTDNGYGYSGRITINTDFYRLTNGERSPTRRIMQHMQNQIPAWLRGLNLVADRMAITVRHGTDGKWHLYDEEHGEALAHEPLRGEKSARRRASILMVHLDDATRRGKHDGSTPDAEARAHAWSWLKAALQHNAL